MSCGGGEVTGHRKPITKSSNIFFSNIQWPLREKKKKKEEIVY